MQDRDNKQFVCDRVRNTLRVFNLICEVSPDPVFPSEAAALLDIPELECSVILISLAYDEWVRETEVGFQTLGHPIKKRADVPSAHASMDLFFKHANKAVPRRRHANGAWASEVEAVPS